MAFKDSVENILNAAMRVFGETLTYLPFDEDPYEFTGVFSRVFVPVSVGEGSVIDTDSPTVGTKVSALNRAPSKKDQVQKGTQLFNIISNQPDGEGGITLILQETDV